MYAEVVIDHQLSKLHDSFTYKVPEDLQVQPGQIVLVPFGAYRKRGVAVSITKESPAQLKGVKKIIKLSAPEPILSELQLRLAYFMAQHYACTLIDAVKLMIPTTIWKGEYKAKERKVAHLVGARRNAYSELKNAPKQQEVLRELAAGKEVKYSPILKALEKKGLVKIEKQRVWRSLTSNYTPEKEREILMSPKQADALTRVLQTPNSIFLLHGITSSGKTEVYLRAIEETLKQEKQAIYLVPEIALTPQTIQRLINRFGKDVAVWHHKLSAGEKTDEWLRIRSGEAKVVVGSRSALFTPAHNLGLIVIDEEHEGSYKQEKKPCYDSRDVASFLAKKGEIKVILGSATPSVESYHLAKTGEYSLLELDQRIGKGVLPDIEVVDLRDEFKKKNYSYFSDKLQGYLKEALRQNQQSILFLNRRGTASGLLCRDCGWRSVCPNCDVTMTLHGNKLVCHYCDLQQIPPTKCPVCQSVAIKSVGVGTQKVENELKKILPGIRVLRADSDTTGSKSAHEDIYRKFKNHEADVLVGTQMIAKGWDLPRVSLVGIIIADIGLHLPDYKASERVFSLITQVAGRAGRGSNPGKVVLQTYTPEHEAIRFGKKHDYLGFYENEIKTRKTFSYPPFSRLLKLTCVDTNEKKALEEAKKCGVRLRQSLKKIEVHGPTPAYPPRIYGKYHFNLFLKLPHEQDIESILELVPKVGWRVNLG